MKILDTIVQSEPVTKGLSEDEKYRVITADGAVYLLRIFSAKQYERKKVVFDRMSRLSDLGVPMCRPIEFGICGESVYSLQGWIDGKDVEGLLPLLPETRQYVLGIESGGILRKIHTVPSPENTEPWDKRYDNTIRVRLNVVRECGTRFEGEELLLDYIEKYKSMIQNRPQCLLHGDYHIGNMMLDSQNNLFVIDWDNADFDNIGDPWVDLIRITAAAQKSPHFATGQIYGYFGKHPPEEFWKLFAFYVSVSSVTAIPWAIRFGQEMMEEIIRLNRDVLAWFDNMKNPVPTWYLPDFYVQYIDGVPCKLKAPFDFSFLKKYGKVFKIYDDQDSGNICFGVANGGKRYFVKFAGAPTERSGIPAAEAVANLKRTVPVYRDLAHPNLVRLLSAEEVGDGFAVVFEWTDGECMGKQYPLSRQKFLQMPSKTKLRVFNEILSIHEHVAKQGYVAIDFYDGSILYDFSARRTVICDIDFYAKMPYINNTGRMWGSSRFMSPEEFTLGAVIDEITNVYTMGATAFALFVSEQDRSFEKWSLGKALYDVAAKAVSENRNSRQQSIRQLISEWSKAKEAKP